MAQESRLAIVIDSRTAEQRANDLKTVLDYLERSGAKASVILRGVGDSAKGVGDKSKIAAQSVGEMATALASVVSVGKLWQQIEKATFAAGRYDQIGIIMEVVGRNAGYSRYELAGLQTELEATGISMTQSRQVITQMIQAQMDLGEATQLARLAQDAATIGNISSSDALQRLVYGVQTAQTEILRNIGIVVNFENAYSKLAAELGKTSSGLSEQEKMQARANAVMEQGSAIAGAYEASMENANKQMGSMERHADNLAVKLGEAYQPAFALAIEGMTEGLKVAGDNSKLLSVALAGFTVSAATATTGVLALRGGVVALHVALNAMKAHPVIMALSVLSGAVVAAGVAFSNLKTDTDVGGAGLDDFSKKVDALRTKVSELRKEEAAWSLKEVTKEYEKLQGTMGPLGARIEYLQVQLEKHPSSKLAKEWNDELIDSQKKFLEASDKAEAYRLRIADLEGQLQSLKSTASAIDPAAGAAAVLDEFLSDVEKRMRAMRVGVSAVARANEIISENTNLTEDQRKKILDAARAEDQLRESLRKTTTSTRSRVDTGAEYLKQLQEQIALLGKETEHQRLLAMIASGSLTFRTEKMREAAEMLAQQLDDTQQQIEMEEVLRDMHEQQTTTQLQFFRELEAFGQGERVRQLNADLARVEDRYRSLIEARRNSPLGLSDTELALIQESLQTELDMVRDFHDKKLEIQHDWRLGSLDALINYAEEAANVYESMGRAIENMFQGMEGALSDFVTRGKLDFRSLADSIIQDMVRIAIQQSVTGPLAGAFGNWLGGLGAPSASSIGITGVRPGLSLASGGYTGDGGKYEPAGIVHKGEGVLSQEEIRAIGGETGFNALRRAIRAGGHAVGGMAGRPIPSPSVGASAGGINVSITINRGGRSEVDAPAGLEQLGKEIGELVEGKIREHELRSQRQGGLAWRARQGAFS